MRALLVFIFAVLTPGVALAHTGHGDTSGLIHGFLHPLGGLDHILAMLAVGVLAGVLGGRALWLVPLSFVAMMVSGFALGIAGVSLPFVEMGIAVSSIVIGAAAAWGRPLPVAGAMALVGIFAIFHGHAHGAEMPATADGLAYAGGFVAASLLLHLAGIAGTVAVSTLLGRYGRVAARLAGGVFALAGIGILGGWL